MGDIFNISLSDNFIESCTNVIARETENFKKKSLLIFPNKRFITSFLQQNIFLKTEAILIPKIISYKGLSTNILKFSEYVDGIEEFFLKISEGNTISDNQFNILLKVIIEKLKTNDDSIDDNVLNSLSLTQIKQAVLECYHYQYNIDNIFPYSEIEKILFLIIKELKIQLGKSKLKLQIDDINNCVDFLISNWKTDHEAKIFAVFPQIDSKYTTSLLDHISKQKNSYIFIRGMCNHISESDKLKKNSYNYHIEHFINRNKIHSEQIHNISNSYKLDSVINQIFINNDVLQNSIFEHVNILEAENNAEEARLISIVIKEYLHKNNNAKIMVQSKSIDIANKIEGFLKLWDIPVDNRLNSKFNNKKHLLFSFKIAKYFITGKNDYLLLLDILKDNYSKYCNDIAIKEFELNCLRKSFYYPNIKEYIDDYIGDENLDFLVKLDELFRNTKKKIHKNTHSLIEYLSINFEICKLIINDEEKEELEILYQRLHKELCVVDFNISYITYIEIMETLYSKFESQMDHSIGYPVKILQTFENRNIQYEFLIFAGLNEGVFPNTNLDHNCITQYTRISNKLREFDTEIGFMEYDFINALTSKNVLFTFSSFEKGKGKNRWVEKLLFNKNLREKSKKYSNQYKDLLRSMFIDENKKDEILYAEVPFSALPSKISVSGIGKLISNPYLYYSMYILKIKALDKISRKPSKKEFGIILHEVISKVTDIKSDDISTFCDGFISLFINCSKKYNIPEEINKIWIIRVEVIAKNLFWYLSDINTENVFKEVFGSTELEMSNNKRIKIYCIADRIECYEEGMKIIDFKTGLIPSNSQVNRGEYPQLSIEKYILSKCGFKYIKNHGDVDKIKMSYIDISGKQNIGIEHFIVDEIYQTEASIRELIECFFINKEDFFIKLNNKNLNQNLEYLHLMRGK